MHVIPVKTGILKPRFHLLETLAAVLSGKRPLEGDIVVISSKATALSQGLMIKLASVIPGKKAKKLALKNYIGLEDPRMCELVLREADKIFHGAKFLTTIKNGVVIPFAGIDRSNVPDGFAILWPQRPELLAQKLWHALKKKFRIKNFGILICDSRCQPLRAGTTGLALGWAGFLGVEDVRGKRDIYGKPLRLTRKAVADNLASAALLVMGEADEQTPFALARSAPVIFTNRVQSQKELTVPAKECVFGGMLYC